MDVSIQLDQKTHQHFMTSLHKHRISSLLTNFYLAGHNILNFIKEFIDHSQKSNDLLIVLDERKLKINFYYQVFFYSHTNWMVVKFWTKISFYWATIPLLAVFISFIGSVCPAYMDAGWLVMLRSWSGLCFRRMVG